MFLFRSFRYHLYSEKDLVASSLPDQNDGHDSLKRNYLRLLPPARVIEICLTFEPHVPIYVKNAIWPADLNAAIVALQLQKPFEPQSNEDAELCYPPEDSSQVLPTSKNTSDEDASRQANAPETRPLTSEVAQDEVPSPTKDLPIDLTLEPPTASTEASQTDRVASAQQTLQKVLEELSRSATPAQPSAAAASSPPPSSTQNNITPVPSTSENASQSQQPHASTSQTTTQSSTPQPSSSSHPTTPHPTHPHAHQAPYAYHPYGYPIPGHAQQPPYPHTPYYGAPPGYATPYPGYPPYPPPLSGYPAHPMSAAASMYAARPPIAHMHPPHPTHPPPAAMPAPPPPPPSGDDLPSYEDMIVEALLDIVDPDGAAPRDLFNWMEARYPLQTNFRPSASQALQKAFKRGRLEKRAGGKYRLNASWEGGTTSRRTTRRPQTLAQTNYNLHHSPQQPSSPFTNAPLARGSRASSATPMATAGGQHIPYGSYPYGYPAAGYGSYPGYPAYQAQMASKAPLSSAISTAASASNANKTAKEPAQAEKASEEDTSGAERGDAWEAAQHILNVINFNSLQAQENQPSTSGDATAASTSASAGLNASLNANITSTALSDEHRASLQAQLALLAAQLTELAEMDEEEEPVEVQPAAALVPEPAPSMGITLPAFPDDAHVMIDVNHFPEEVQHASHMQAHAGSDDENSDADMEMVEVPVMAALKA
ncbi:unnamed protein product [Somion occarium]|uniref:Histone H1 n=1 Tax=Somion occarium TaxID=3059160 RepID=A0ABP1DZ83_9APHY